MAEFKVGDRAAFYDGNGRFVATVHGVWPEYLVLSFDEHPTPSERAHPKQCRRLKKKERRRVWMHTEDDKFVHFHQGTTQCVYAPDDKYRCVEFIEVKK